MRKKSEHVFGYIFRDQNITTYPPYKNFILKILIREEVNTEKKIDKTREGQVKVTISGHEKLGVTLLDGVFLFPNRFSRSMLVL